MMQTIPNLVRMSNYPFEEKVLAIDTAPLSGDKVMRPGLGTMEQLRGYTQKLLEMGVVDRLVDINYDPAYRNQIYQKHFHSPIRATHNYKGYPILGSIFTIEECKSDYIVHFDSDMMMYQQSDYSWIEESIHLMLKDPNLMFVRPLSGPPTDDPSQLQHQPDKLNPAGFYQYQFFGSRVYLINRQRFEQLIPFPIIWRTYRQKFMDSLPLKLKTLLNNLTGKGKLESWEIMVSEKVKQTDYYRGTLSNPKAWTLHPKDRSDKFIAALPDIIKRIESGDYPPQQAGYYDLISELWY
jgi:hypothetical protein